MMIVEALKKIVGIKIVYKDKKLTYDGYNFIIISPDGCHLTSSEEEAIHLLLKEKEIPLSCLPDNFNFCS